MATSPKVPAPFMPVPVRARHDGWSVERQIAFLEKLADCGSITSACKHVGMSRESVRQLRRRPGARDFRDACDAALDCGYGDLELSAFERAKNGVPRPVFYKGEQVGEWRKFDEKLTMFLLRFRRRHRFGAGTDVPMLPPSNIPGFDEPQMFDPEGELNACLEGGDFGDEPGPDQDGDWPSAPPQE